MVSFNVTTRRYIAEDSKLHIRLRENLKSHHEGGLHLRHVIIYHLLEERFCFKIEPK
jgi:hypothetical protein